MPGRLQAAITGNTPSSAARPGATLSARHFLLSTAHLTPGCKPSLESLEPSNSRGNNGNFSFSSPPSIITQKVFLSATHTSIFSPPISLGCPGNFQAERSPVRGREGDLVAGAMCAQTGSVSEVDPQGL